jgi:outer membrane protein OmpA-like peptidoglycan-associated protein
VVDLAALNLFVLPTIHDEAATIAASPPLVPSEAYDMPARAARANASALEQESVESAPVAIVEFYRASYRITHVGERILSSAVPTLGSSGSVTVVGHADATGSDDLNDRLSEDRADAVARRLIALGIRPARVRVEARGAREPRSDGIDRRVEIFLGDAP